MKVNKPSKPQKPIPVVDVHGGPPQFASSVVGVTNIGAGVVCIALAAGPVTPYEPQEVRIFTRIAMPLELARGLHAQLGNALEGAEKVATMAPESLMMRNEEALAGNIHRTLGSAAILGFPPTPPKDSA